MEIMSSGRMKHAPESRPRRVLALFESPESFLGTSPTASYYRIEEARGAPDQNKYSPWKKNVSPEQESPRWDGPLRRH